MRFQFEEGDRLSQPTGYGQFNRDLVKYLLADGHTVGTEFNRIEDTPDTIHFYCSPPYSFKNLKKDRFNVGLTMTERETTAGYHDDWMRLHGLDWKDFCNQMSLIITPSEWNKQVFIRDGVTTPIAVMPMGVDVNFWCPNRPFRFFSSIDGWGSPSSRWNWKELLQAFTEEFHPDEECEWTVIVRDGRNISDGKDTARIKFIRFAQTSADMLDLYRSHDCYLSYSREGWGCPQWEALASGEDVIVPRYGVQAETMPEIRQVHFFDGGRLSEDNLKFVDGNIEDLKYQMRKTYNSRRFGIEMAKKNRYENIVKLLVKTINDSQQTS